MIPFGKECREKYFQETDPEALLTNHGSFGLTPTPVHQKLAQYVKEDAAFPDKYILYKHEENYYEAIDLIAEFVHSDRKNIALVDNATTGIAAILQSIDFKEGDKVVVSSLIYPSNINYLYFLQEKIGIEIISVVINVLEQTNDDIIASLRAVFSTSNVKLCLWDAVSSMPAIRLPFEKVIDLCKEFNVISLIDSAHGIGMYPIDFREIKPDFLVTNLHKWFYAPRPKAFLYADPAYHSIIQPIPIAHYYKFKDDNPNTLSLKFLLGSTKDMTKDAAIKDAFQFVEDVGGLNRIWDYEHELRAKTRSYIAERYPEVQFLHDSDDHPISLLNYYLPLQRFATQDQIDKMNNLDFTTTLKKNAIAKNAYLQLSDYRGKVFVRFSFQIYNVFEDYVRGVELLETLSREYFSQ